MNTTRVTSVAIIGVGLIGGSAAAAWRRAGCVDRLIGAGRGRTNLERALELGLIDEIAESPADAAARSDLVLLAVPVGATADVLTDIAPALSGRTVVTDAGSTKTGVVADARRILGRAAARFVPGHPVAGTEYSGADAAFAALFENRRVILTPDTETDPAALSTVRGLWEAAGAQVCEMTPEHHDAVLAATSHLPHVLAYQLVDTLAGLDEQQEIFDYAAGGFADFTRIASSSPAMWSDIVQANRDCLLPVIDRYLAELSTLRQALADNDRDAVNRRFERAKVVRDRFVDNRTGQT